jgi:hypothetical protein
VVKWTKLYLVPIECVPKYFKKFCQLLQNSNYLAKHDMEWLENRCDKGQAQNALGQVKFVFQTLTLFICMTPIKKLYLTRNRFSHGCIRVARPRDLNRNFRGWSKWTVENRCSHESRRSKTYNLKNSNTSIHWLFAWVDREGQIHFMKISTDTTSACLQYYFPTYKKKMYLVGVQNANLIGVC